MLTLRLKLTLALIITGLSGILILAFLVEQFTVSEFDNFVMEQERANFIENMTSYYEVYGSWDNLRMAGDGLPIAAFPMEPPPDVLTEAPPFRFFLVDVDGHMIMPNPGNGPERHLPPEQLKIAEPIIVDGETVAYVATDDRWQGRDRLEQEFLIRIRRYLLIAMGGAVIIALLLSLLFARSLTHPLREIALAIQSISRGQLEQRVPVRSQDEIGQVALAFNQMSADLAREHHLRRQMTADIAHELRTPLSVVVGYLASLSDGLLRPTPERFKTMHDEALHLQRLVEDLRTMSLADAGELSLNRQPVKIDELLSLTAAAFTHQAEQQQVQLRIISEDHLPVLQADPDRLLQVFSNLVSNALRHTPAGGQITLAANKGTDALCITIQDTGVGIAAHHLPHLFERFYRADAAREHHTEGESGLGLAIAKSLIEAHGGTITVTSTEGVGTTFTIILVID